ncbi:LapA family protein [Ottowia sp.]|uniref:LapA family protein n=1 Tax=Ottowia sp. TaxID=1898956 RepID=UPI00260C7806|nr:LapA family protein [Ottowia sp.]
MSLRSLILLVVGVLILIFVGVNWTEMTRPTDLSLIVTDVHAPLGLVLLGIMVLLAVLFIGLIAYTQAAVLMETRRQSKELAAQRELADKAELSRFTELRSHLDAEVSKLSESVHRQSQDLMSRVDRAEMGLRERPIDENIGRLVKAVDDQNRELHARLDRLEMGLGDRMTYLANSTPALVSASTPPQSSPAARPAPQAARDNVVDADYRSPSSPPVMPDDPVGTAVPR